MIRKLLKFSVLKTLYIVVRHLVLVTLECLIHINDKNIGDIDCEK
jgi:hypothetical protein